jgi:hypothetical protein
MALTSGTVIDSITRRADVGEPGYSAYGQSLRKCTYSGSKDDWHGATQGSLSDLLPTCYITESVYSYLTDAEIESVRSRIQGIVPTSYAYKHGVCPDYGKCYKCWEFKAGIEARPLPPLDPCEVVVCEDECVGVDRYAMVCKDGVCVRGELVEANSVECGYVKPECAEGDKKTGHICRGGKWVPYTPVGPVPGEGRLYVKFDIPWLDLLPGIPYEPWMIIPPGFKVVEEKQ